MIQTVETRSAKAPAPSLFPLQQIVVPTDLSEASLIGVRYAVKLAGHFDSMLTVLHVFKDPSPLGAITGYYFSDDFDQLRHEAQLKLTEIMDDVIVEHPRSVACCLFGRPSAQIVGMAKALNSDLIVISDHDYHGFRRLAGGCESERIIRYAPCPVLVVYQNGHDFVPEAIGN
jgi:nucleotide-binding universal stress UspA family protein